MSLDNDLSKIMDVVRHFTGRTDKLSFDDAINALLKLKTNGLVASELDWNKYDDLNVFTTPGIYSVWLKPMKNVPMAGNDQGAILVVIGTGDWTAQIMFTFYSGAYYRADTMGALKQGHVTWKQFNVTDTNLGGVVKAVLSALHLERRCLA